MKKVLTRRGVLVFSFLLWAGMLTSLALAQLPTATILGVVKDATGAVVPGATLTVTNADTGLARTTNSGGDGLYVFPALPVGSYEVRAQQAGFQTAVLRGLTLVVGQDAVINFALQPGAGEQTVEARVMTTTSGAAGGMISEGQLADLPVNARNYIDLTLTESKITEQKNVSGGQPTAAGLWYSSNGAPVRSNNYMLDGALMKNLQGIHSASITGATMGIEGIREYRILTNSFSAEYGVYMGSQVAMASKGGTNEFHGSVFEFLRNDVMDARNFFDYPSAGTGPDWRLPAYRRNQFGASGGGPIKQGQTFFFAVYEGLRQRLGVSPLINVLGAGCHAPAGATVTNTACPQLGTVSSVTVSPVTAPMLDVFPLPNLPNNQFTFRFSEPTRDDYGQMRVDHTFSANDSLFARYTASDGERLALSPGAQYPQVNLPYNSRSQFATLSETHVFSPALLMTARFSFSRISPMTDAIWTGGPQHLFMPDNTVGLKMEQGGISMGGVTGISGTSAPTKLFQNIITWSDDLFYTRGRHSLKFGTLINRFQQYNYNRNGARGSLDFANVADFLRARARNYSAANLPGDLGAFKDRSYRFTTLGFYAQDDFRLWPNFTLNLGLRWEFSTQYYEKFGVQAAIRDIQHDTGPAVGVMYLNPTKPGLSPRFGFAWDVRGDGQTSVRGGFGLLYDVTFGGTAIDPMSTSHQPFSSGKTVINPPSGSFTIPFTWPATAGTRNWYFDYNLRQPHLLSYNLTVERQLPGDMAVTLAYAGSRGINIINQRDGNPTVPQGVPGVDAAGNRVCVARPAGQSFDIADITQPFCWLGNDPVTNPNLGFVWLTAGSQNSFYNALQVGLVKRMTRGLQFQSSYTWSRMIDEGQGDAGGDTTGSTMQNTFPTRRNIERSLADFDMTQNWRFNAIYQWPDLVDAGGVGGALLNGWGMRSILSLSTGYPFTPALQANRSRSNVMGAAARIDRPDLVASRKGSDIVSGTTAGCLGVAPGQQLGTPTLYFDPCAFTIQPAGFLGTAGRNILRGPGLVNLDFALTKNTPLRLLGESGELQFRAEFFNILNRANFRGPDATTRSIYAGRADVESALGAAGKLLATGTTSRQIQLALKLVF